MVRGSAWVVFGAAVLVAAGLGAPLAPGLTGPVGLDVAVAGLVRDLGVADSWSRRVGAFSAWAPGLEPVMGVGEERSIPVIMGGLYASLGLPWSSADAASIEAQAAALPVPVARGFQVLLGAVERSTADVQRITKAWPVGVDAVDVPREDLRVLRGAAMRVLAAVDVATPLFQLGVDAGASSGVLLRDPFDLVMVGGVENSEYYGNTVPALVGIHPQGVVLIVDLAGDDIYRNHPGAAYPQPMWVCHFGCGRGIPVSVVVDVVGNDRYVPARGGGAMGHGSTGGLGFLVDVAGDDVYFDGYYGVSLGTSLLGVGLMLDGAGNDGYTSLSDSMGAGQDDGVAMLIDVAGNDRYTATRSAVQGSAINRGLGVFADLGGDDVVVAQSCCSQGYGSRGFAFSLNLGGDDAYSTVLGKARGWSTDCEWLHLGRDCAVSVFLDVCGYDTYVGPTFGVDGGSWQQEDFGFGRDVNEPSELCSLWGQFQSGSHAVMPRS